MYKKDSKFDWQTAVITDLFKAWNGLESTEEIRLLNLAGANDLKCHPLKHHKNIQGTINRIQLEVSREETTYKLDSFDFEMNFTKILNSNKFS